MRRDANTFTVGGGAKHPRANAELQNNLYCCQVQLAIKKIGELHFYKCTTTADDSFCGQLSNMHNKENEIVIY